jgi:hypothetical protein
MNQEVYEQVCQAAGCDLRVGLDFAGLCKIYLELRMGTRVLQSRSGWQPADGAAARSPGNIEEDFALMTGLQA